MTNVNGQVQLAERLILPLAGNEALVGYAGQWKRPGPPTAMLL